LTSAPAVGLDDIDAIQALDSLDMLGTAESFGEQCKEAWNMGAGGSELPSGEGLNSIAVLGMGGSGAAGDIVQAIVEPRLPLFFRTIKDPRSLPEWIGRNTLVFAVSYSGNTAETIAALQDAHLRGVRGVTISSGGRLEELAAEFGTTHIRVPADVPQPRAALGYLAVPIMWVLSEVGLVPDLRADLYETVGLMGGLAQRCDRKRKTEQNPAKSLSLELAGRIPVIYGVSGAEAAVARKFKCDVNEYAKWPAFWNELPELDHNEIVGWDGASGLSSEFVAVMLTCPDADQVIADYRHVTKELIEESLGGVVEIPMEGRSTMAQIFSTVFMTQLVSIYLAVARGVDPGPIETIDRFKAELESRVGVGEGRERAGDAL
jgi:glucose/mannose-6-phosphate isomerase